MKLLQVLSGVMDIYIDYEEESGAISVMLYMYIRNIVKFNFCIFIDKT